MKAVIRFKNVFDGWIAPRTVKVLKQTQNFILVRERWYEFGTWYDKRDKNFEYELITRRVKK